MGALLLGAAAISTLSACGRMAVKYGAPPSPRPEASTGAEAGAGEPEAGEAEAGEAEAGAGEAEAPPADEG